MKDLEPEATMKIEDISEHLLRGRITDLSKKATPGGAEGPVDTGKRKYEIEPFSYPPGEIMHSYFPVDPGRARAGAARAL